MADGPHRRRRRRQVEGDAAALRRRRRRFQFVLEPEARIDAGTVGAVRGRRVGHVGRRPPVVGEEAAAGRRPAAAATAAARRRRRRSTGAAAGRVLVGVLRVAHLLERPIDFNSFLVTTTRSSV